MQTFQILVPTDFSEHSRMALQLAITLAKDHHPALLHLVHVEEPAFTQQDEDLGVFEPGRLIAAAQLAHTERDAEISMATKILKGRPADELLTYAEKKKVDMIVMGTHGRVGLAHALLGSVAAAIIRKATCPVITVKAVSSAARGSDAVRDR